MNYSQITEQIFVGTNACCKTHFDTFLLHLGITADISMEAENIDAPWGIKYFMWLPTIDHTAPTMEALALGVQMMRFCMEHGLKLFVHCKNGHGRAPTLVAAYFVSQGMSVDKAIKTIQKQRKEIHVEPVQRARLEQFAKSFRW